VFHLGKLVPYLQTLHFPGAACQEQAYYGRKKFFSTVPGYKGPYSKHFIFFVTYEWAQQVRVFVLDKSFQTSVTLYLTGPIHKLQRKLVVVDESPSSLFI
jgi:hypothetical protein